MEGVASYRRLGGATGLGGDPDKLPLLRFCSAALAHSSSSVLPSFSWRV